MKTRLGDPLSWLPLAAGRVHATCSIQLKAFSRVLFLSGNDNDEPIKGLQFLEELQIIFSGLFSPFPEIDVVAQCNSIVGEISCISALNLFA